MRYFLIGFVFTQFTACGQTSTNNNFERTEKGIVYFFPLEVENIIKDNIPKNKDSVFLNLSISADNLYKISIIKATRASKENWAYVSNRIAYIGGNFFPMVFDYDMQFASSDSLPEVKRKIRVSSEFDVNRSRTIHHNYFFILFSRQGKIISSGYE